jgi:glutamyl aminopeptidase
MIEEKLWKRIKKYTELQGTSGQEFLVRNEFKKELSPLVDEIKQDGLGGIFGIKNIQDQNAPRVMIAAHLDEVGFVVTKILSTGLLQIAEVGGWNPLTVSSQRFTLFTDHNKQYPVVSSAVSPHLLRGGNGPSVPKVEDILFDAGFTSREEAQEFGVRPGNFIVPEVETILTANQKRVMSKSWDNRFGLVTILEALEELKDEQLPNTLILGADVQEEVGLRGASGATHLLQPDIFFALDSSAADDLTSSENQGQLDGGTLIRVYDPRVVSPVRLVEFITEIAKENNIKTQYFVSKGGTDAGSAQISNDGIPSMGIGVVSRYIHTHQTVWSLSDLNEAKKLVVAIAKNLTKEVLDNLYK